MCRARLSSPARHARQAVWVHSPALLGIFQGPRGPGRQGLQGAVWSGAPHPIVPRMFIIPTDATSEFPPCVVPAVQLWANQCLCLSLFPVCKMCPILVSALRVLEEMNVMTKSSRNVSYCCRTISSLTTTQLEIVPISQRRSPRLREVLCPALRHATVSKPRGSTVTPSSTPGVRGSEATQAWSLVQWRKTDTQTVALPRSKSCDGDLGSWGNTRRVLT